MKDSCQFPHGTYFTKVLGAYDLNLENYFALIFIVTHWGLVTHKFKLTIIGSDNGLSPGWHQAIIWTNAGILLTGPLGTNFSEILIEIYSFSSKKMHFKMSSERGQPFCLSLNILIIQASYNFAQAMTALHVQNSDFTFFQKITIRFCPRANLNVTIWSTTSWHSTRLQYI